LNERDCPACKRPIYANQATAASSLGTIHRRCWTEEIRYRSTRRTSPTVTAILALATISPEQ
jgi:hypothetical protein